MRSHKPDEVFQIDNPVEHDIKYFAMLNNAVAIADTKLEGGSNAKAFDYYNYLLNLKLPHFPLEFNLTREQEQHLKDGIANLIKIQTLINESYKNGNLFTKQGMDQVLTVIEEHSKQLGSCYLPSGWRGDPGHFCGLKLRPLEDGHYAFSLLNHGGGISYHLLAPKSGSKDQYIYQSNEYDIDIKSEEGRELLQRLFEIYFGVGLDKNVNNFSADDLYGLIKLYGKELPLKDKLSEKAVTPQRGGTCTITNTHAIARDILIDHQADLKTRKRYHFVLKLRSIIDGFNAYQQGRCPHNVLEWALREFAVRLQKEYRHTLTDEEMIFCGQLQAQIQQRLEKDKEALIQTKCTNDPFPSFEGKAPLYRDRIFLIDPDIQKDLPIENKPIQPKMQSAIQPKDVLSLLKHEVTHFDFKKIYALFNSFPHCSGKDIDPFWDKVPQNDIGKIIQQLLKMVTKLKSEKLLSQDQGQVFALALMAYDIAAQLSPRHIGEQGPVFQLGDKYTFGLDDIYSEQKFFTDPIAYYTVKRITENFEERSKTKERVFTNAVNYNQNKYDQTVHYLIKIILNDDQREALAESLKNKIGGGTKKFTDLELFAHLMENLEMLYGTEYVLDHDVAALMSLSATAHNLGDFTKGYKKSEKSELWNFIDSRFHHELARKKALEKLEIANHLPKTTNNPEITHQDFSENTIYHPADDLKKLQKAYKSWWSSEISSEAMLYPYQLYPSGSLSPESAVWEPTSEQESHYESLNEDLRHIECTPNLQIVRAFAWAGAHLNLLRHPVTRIRINELLFQYGKLDNAFANQREPTLINMNRFLAAVLNYCQNEAKGDNALLLWAAKLANDLRYHLEVTASLYHFPIHHYTLPSFREILLRKLKDTEDSDVRSKLASTLVCDFLNSHPLSAKDCSILLIARMIANQGDSVDASNEVWQKLNTVLLEKLAENEKAIVNEFNRILPDYIKLTTVKTWELKGSQLTAIGTDLFIDLLTGALQKRGLDDTKERTQKTIDENKALFDRLQISSKDIVLFYSGKAKDHRVLKSADGQWEFTYFVSERSWSSDSQTKFIINKTKQWINIEGTRSQFTLLDKQLIENLNNLSEEIRSFETMDYFETNYQYWQSVQEPTLLFVRQKNSAYAYCYSTKYSTISQLIMNEEGDWQRNGTLLLNLRQALASVKKEQDKTSELTQTDHREKNQIETTEFEKQWARRLEPIFGVDNIRCIAHLDNDKQTWRMHRIEHLTLGLNFTVNAQQYLMCDEFPEYFLSEQKSIKALHGFPIVILQNQEGDRKYLMPAFSLKVGEKNNAFNQDQIVDCGTFCNKSIPYYLLSLNAKNEVVGQSAEENLFLAIIYRSLGDFKQAFHYLSLCHSSQNITATTAAIALQVLTRKIKSPMGAAFDLKMASYLNEHKQKWSKDKVQKFEPVNFPEDWNKWIKEEQLHLYRNTFSNYKIGVAILPSYARLTEDDFKWLGTQLILPDDYVCMKPKNRIMQASVLPKEMFHGQDAWRRYIDKLESKVKFSLSSAKLPSLLTTLRFSVDQNKTPALLYLVKHFGALFQEARSNNPKRIDHLNKTLFLLLQNDEDAIQELYELVVVLKFVSQYPHYFNRLSYADNFNLIFQVGEIFSQHKELAGTVLPLIADEKWTAITLSANQPLPKDHKPSPTTFAMSTLNYEEVCKYPLKNIAERFFIRRYVPIAEGPFALEEASLSHDPTIEKIEKRLFNLYQKGHKENQEKLKAVYEARPEENIHDLRNALEKLKEEDHTLIIKLENALLIRGNRTPIDHPEGNEKAKAHQLQLARASEQHQPITISLLLTSFLRQDTSLLTSNNPFLTQEDVSRLYADLADYALLHSRIDQMNQSLEMIAGKKSFNDLESYKLQLLASTLDKSRAYSVKEFPEFLVYEYATKRLLREDQVKTLIKVIELIEKPDKSGEMNHALLQFAAGGGKSSVLIPILAQRFARKGFLPLIFNTNELYELGLVDIPKNLQDSFQQNMEVIDRELDYRWTTIELTRLREDLERWRKEGKCVLLKSVTWHSINLAIKLGVLREKGGAEPKVAASVLEYFKTHCVKLEDECHLISDPLQQSIKTFGKKKSIPADHLSLLIKCYDYLMGHTANSEEIATLAGIKANRKHSVTANELKQLQNKLAHVIVSDPGFQAIPREALVLYLTQAETKKPDWLKALYEKRVEKPGWQNEGYDEEFIKKCPNITTKVDHEARDTAELIVLARAFLQTHLPHILSLQYQKDYGASIHEGDLTVAPKHDGNDVTSHFGDHTLVAALTIQMYLQRGLLPAQVEQLLTAILKDHNKERVWNPNTEVPTLAEQTLMNWIPERYPFNSYLDLTPELTKQLSTDHEFFKNPEIIKKYLLEFALPQIVVPEQRQTSTAAEFQAAFNRSLMLSATPGLPEIYPAFLKPENCFLEEAFEAQVLDTLLQSQNKGLLTLKKMQSPKEFFEQFPPDLLNKMTTLIDRGALMTDFSGQEIVTAYLALDKGQRGAHTGTFFAKDDKMHLKTKDPTVKEINFSGAGLVKELKKQGKNPEQYLLFLFLNLSKTTGTDIKRPYNDHAGLTVGKGQTSTESFQAAMRERQLLDKGAQSISWIMFESLYREIDKEAKPGTFDPRKVFYWMIRNEAQAIKTKLINRAYQGIDQALYGLAWHEAVVGRYPLDYTLREYIDLSPWKNYEIESNEVNTAVVLNRYVENTFSKLNKDINDRYKITIPNEVKERIDQIIIETVGLIDTLTQSAQEQDTPRTTLSNEVQQEIKTELQVNQEIKTETRMKTKLESASDFVFENERYSLGNDNLTVIFDKTADQKENRYQLLRLPGCDDIKQPNLLFCQDHFKVLETAPSVENQFTQLKPINVLLVKIMPDHQTQYLACTAAGAEYFSFLLKNDLVTEKYPAYALMTTDGDILSTSKNITPDQCTFVETADCQQMLTYAHFLNGAINNPIVLNGLIKEQGWTKTHYLQLTEAIKNIHVSSHSVSLLGNKTLERMCGWSDQKSHDATPATSHARYRKPSSISDGSTRPLQAAPVEKSVETLPPIPSPERALEGYVFGEETKPIADETETVELAQLVKNIFSLSNNTITEREYTLAKLRVEINQIVTSLKPTSEKLQEATRISNAFHDFDNLLQRLCSKFKKFTDPAYENSRELAMQAIGKAYQDYAEELSTERCIKNLQINLEDLYRKAALQKGPRIRLSIFGKDSPTPFSSKNKLAEVLKESARVLKQQGATVPIINQKEKGKAKSAVNDRVITNLTSDGGKYYLPPKRK